jgi:hypothetical protein
MPEREDIVKRASKHVGYLSGQGFDQKNRFSDFLGHPAEAWCGDFVTAIYAMCKIPLPPMQAGAQTGFAYVPSGWGYGSQHGATRSSYEAKPGDIVCFDWTKAGTCSTGNSHTGLVDHWANGTLFTIEGNSGPNGGVNAKQWAAPHGQGNVLIAGVINTGKLVKFGGGPAPDPGDDDDMQAPPFPGRMLMLKSPLMTGNDVKTWQVQMRKRGWKLPHHGEYDERTRDVCVAFQKQKGLPDNGRVGPRTWALAWTSPITPD